MVFIAGITLALFIELLLIFKKNKSGSDKILAVWMVLIITQFFLKYLIFSGAIYNYPFLWGVELPIPLIQSVMLYLYIASVTNQLPYKKIWIYLNFLPAFAMYLYLIKFLFLPVEQKAYVYNNLGAGYKVFTYIRLFAIFLSGIIYIAWSLLLLRKHRHNILNKFSYQDKINLQWLRLLIFGIVGIWFLIFLFFLNDIIIFIGVVAFVFMIGFFGIRQSRIFSVEKELPGSNDKKVKYYKSGLTEELSGKLYRELLCLMNEEKLFRKNNLCADDLASRLNIHPNYLSQIINEKEGKNFYDFVNHFRVEDFKRLISDPKNKNLTLLYVALDCGFNSKSSFNRNFKKHTGVTPSVYFASFKKE
jgi:AraC-like DNA-binding protein